MNTIIAFMGFDGSGKTTACELVASELSRRRFKVRVVPGFDHLFLDKIKKLWGAGELQAAYNSGRVTALFKLWPLAVFFECWVSFLYFKFIQKTPIILFDRYFYDWLISFEKLGYSSALTRFLFLNLLPRPNLGWVFMADPQVAYGRKKHDHPDSLSEYEKQWVRYQSFAQENKFRMIDTSAHSVEQVAKEVLDSILLRENPRTFGPRLDSDSGN